MAILLFILQFFLTGMSKKTKYLQIINSLKFKAERIILSNRDQEIIIFQWPWMKHILMELQPQEILPLTSNALLQLLHSFVKKSPNFPEAGKLFMFRSVANSLSQFYVSCILPGVSQLSQVDSFFILSYLYFIFTALQHSKQSQ